MNDALYITIKNGSLYDSIDPLMGAKDKMIVDYADELEWGHEITIPDHHKMVYPTFRVDRRFKPLLKQSLVTGENDALTRRNIFDLDAVGDIIGITDIREKWKSKDVIETIELRDYDISKLIKPAIAGELDLTMKDYNLVTSGTYTWGSGGGFDYLTLAACSTDTGTMDGDLSFTQHTTSTETASPAWAGSAAGFTLSCLNNAPPGGDPTGGNIINVNHTGHGLVSRFTTAGTMVIRDTNFKRVQAAGVGFKTINVGRSGNTYDMHDIIIDCDNLAGDDGGFRVQTASALVKFYNFIIMNSPGTGMLATQAFFAENGLVYNCGTGINGNSKANTIQNVSCFGSTTDFANIGSSTVSNTASEDATSPDNPNLTPANEMELNPALATMGDPKDGSTVATGGKQPTYATTDMYGVSYGVGARPIGPKILPVAPGGIIPILKTRTINKSLLTR